MLDKLLPELHKEAKEHVVDVEKLLKHAESVSIRTKMGPINDRKL
jgi:hypothetical protein